MNLSFLYSSYLALAVVLFFSLFLLGSNSYVFYFPLIKWGIVNNNFADIVFVFDWVSVVFLMVLCIMVSAVGFFSIVYMQGDVKVLRFSYILNLFVFSMMSLMFTPHLMFFLLGWDGLGFTSFLLIKYYNSSSSWGSSLKTFLINRLGDGILIASMGMVVSEGHFLFFLNNLSFFFFIFFLLGLLTKSAHFPFSMWLPAAMAAPTPVSSLVHSSTLVTAGMYVMFRLNFLFFHMNQFVLMGMGFCTLFLGSLMALLSWDSKKVVAFSTLSNLGLMGVSLSMGAMGLAFFHLLAHGVSKALLFVSVGQLMSFNNHSQDLRHFSNGWNGNVFENLSGLWSVMCLLGFFFYSVFFSKDYILELGKDLANQGCMLLIKFSVFLTVMYSFRLLNYLNKDTTLKSVVVFEDSPSSNHYFFSNLMLFMFVLVLGEYLSSYFILYVMSESMFKVMYVGMLALSFYLFSLKFPSFLTNVEFFNSGFFLPVSRLGNFFYNHVDNGLLLGLNNYIHSLVGKLSLSSNISGNMFLGLNNKLIVFMFLLMLLSI